MKLKLGMLCYVLLGTQVAHAHPIVSHDVWIAPVSLNDCLRMARESLSVRGYTLGASGNYYVYGTHGSTSASMFCEDAPYGGSLVSAVVSTPGAVASSAAADRQMMQTESRSLIAYISPEFGAQNSGALAMAPQSGYQQPTQPGYPPQQPIYQPQQPSYQQPGYPQPTQPGYPTQQPSYPQPSYPQPTQSGYPTQQPTYQQPAYPPQPTYPMASNPVSRPDRYRGPVSWINKSSSDPVPDVAIRGGTEADGRPQYVCRARRGDAIIPGKAVTSFGTSCYAADPESHFEILTGSPDDYIWSAYDSSRPPFYTGIEEGVPEGSCRGKLYLDDEDKGTHIGKLIGTTVCKVSYKGRIYNLPKFDILYHR